MKKRITIAIENQMLGNHFIMPGAMQFDPDAEYDVRFGTQPQVIGKARNLKREGDEITAEVELNPLMHLELDDLKGMTYAKGLVYDNEKSKPGEVFVKGAGVEGVSLYDAFGYFSMGANPGATINNNEEN